MKYIKEYYIEGIIDVTDELFDKNIISFYDYANCEPTQEIFYVYTQFQKNNIIKLNENDIIKLKKILSNNKINYSFFYDQVSSIHDKYLTNICIKSKGDESKGMLRLFFDIRISSINDDFYYVFCKGKAYKCDQFYNVKKLILQLVNEHQKLNESFIFNNEEIKDVTNEYLNKSIVYRLRDRFSPNFNKLCINNNELKRLNCEQLNNKQYHTILDIVKSIDIICDGYMFAYSCKFEFSTKDKDGFTKNYYKIIISDIGDSYFIVIDEYKVYKCDQFNNVKKLVSYLLKEKKEKLTKIDESLNNKDIEDVTDYFIRNEYLNKSILNGKFYFSNSFNNREKSRQLNDKEIEKILNLLSNVYISHEKSNYSTIMTLSEVRKKYVFVAIEDDYYYVVYKNKVYKCDQFNTFKNFLFKIIKETIKMDESIQNTIFTDVTKEYSNLNYIYFSSSTFYLSDEVKRQYISYKEEQKLKKIANKNSIGIIYHMCDNKVYKNITEILLNLDTKHKRTKILVFKNDDDYYYIIINSIKGYRLLKCDQWGNFIKTIKLIVSEEIYNKL